MKDAEPDTNAAELAAYGEFARTVGRILPVDEEAEIRMERFERDRRPPRTKPLTRKRDPVPCPICHKAPCQHDYWREPYAPF